MAEFIEGKEQAVNKGDPIIFENKTGSAFDVSVGIVFHESGIYEVSIAENRTVVSKVMERPPAQSEIIRCKDCKWFNDIGCANCAVRIVDDSDKPSEEDYCSFAERRQDDPTA